MRGLDRPPRLALKTDLFEEANGEDQLLFDLSVGQRVAIGFDMSASTADQAGRRAPRSGWPLFVADARALPLRSDSVDLIISTSTLDHMDGPDDLDAALRELCRVLRPGGRMALTLDNPWNPTYHILRAACALPGAPFELGYTASRTTLDRALRRAGLEPISWRALVHNPRGLSTVGFLAIRRLLGKRADPWIGRILAALDLLEKLPTRWISGCFVAVCAAKPEPGGAVP